MLSIGNIRKIIDSSYYILITLLIIYVGYIEYNEWYASKTLEVQNKRIDRLYQKTHEIYIQMMESSLSGETVWEWNNKDMAHYHAQRMAMDSMLCRFKTMYPSECIDSIRYLLESKEQQMRLIVQEVDEKKVINKKIARQVPVIVQKRLEYARSLAARNAKLNRQLQNLTRQMDEKMQADLQKRENEITAMRERPFIYLGSLTGLVLPLLIIPYIILYRKATCIKRYKKETTDLIGQLKLSIRQNEALTTSRKKAVHTIIHELRTPLTAITGYAGLLQKADDMDTIGRYAYSIRQSSDRMYEMLSTLLDFFRLDSGKEQASLSPCRISTIIHMLETEFNPVAINKGLVLTVKGYADAVVRTDKERILQIGSNLLSNAIKFTDNGGVSFTVDYVDGILTFVVEDTGTGMTDEEQLRVFGAFERLSNAAAQDGFGLGLSIVRHVVKMLGGTVRLESRKGKGSRFTVEIPMSKENELPEHDRIPAGRYPDVIAIDNDNVLLLMLKEMYAQKGICCDTCTDTAGLMEMIRRKEYGLLLTDLNMSEINGFELLELLRTSNVGNSRTIPVVVTTASDGCDKKELMACGFAGCLFKPFSMTELMEVSDNCVAKEVQDDEPDFSALLSYGNESVMLDKLIAETEREMLALKDFGQRRDLQGLDFLIHHLRSPWEVLRADLPLRELHRLLHDGIPNEEALRNAVYAVLTKGAEIVRLAKERRRHVNG